jgi:ankyrin repeat protein
MADAMELSKQVWDICKDAPYREDPHVELKAFLEVYPQVDVTLYRGDFNMQAIHEVSEKAYALSMRMLLDHRADIDARDRFEVTPLMSVYDQNDTRSTSAMECVQLLIEAKADLYATDLIGKSVFHYAAAVGDLKRLQLFIDDGADLNARADDGTTLFLSACESSRADSLDCMQFLIGAKADVSVTDVLGQSALHRAGTLECLQALIDHGLDVNARARHGGTPAMKPCYMGLEGGKTLPCLQLLLDNKADLNIRDDENRDALCEAIRGACDSADSLALNSGLVFTLLCCNTDIKNVKIDEDEDTDTDEDEDTDTDEDEEGVTMARVAAFVEEFKQTHAFVDEFHGILADTLYTRVEVDTRFGLGDNGIYQEPLERTLEYLGLSMNKDQVVNTSIDGDIKRRALLPFHLVSAEVWYKKQKNQDMEHLRYSIRQQQAIIDAQLAKIRKDQAELRKMKRRNWRY